MQAPGATLLAPLQIVPFVPGRRPAAEAAHPGLGSSEEVAVILAGDEEDPACVLYTLPAAGLPGVGVRVSLSLRGAPVPGWESREIPIERFVATGDGQVRT